MTAVKWGQLGIVRRLMLVGEFKEMVMSSGMYGDMAAEKGHLEIVKYLRECRSGR